MDFARRSICISTKNKIVTRLLEDDCDPDKRIFGDHEYIPFNRENIGPALIKLSELINKKLL